VIETLISKTCSLVMMSNFERGKCSLLSEPCVSRGCRGVQAWLNGCMCQRRISYTLWDLCTPWGNSVPRSSSIVHNVWDLTVDVNVSICQRKVHLWLAHLQPCHEVWVLCRARGAH
jgi:hypothetical protein